MPAIFVRNLHPGVAEGMVFERFSPAGHIESVHICRDKKTGASLGYAYVNFRHRHQAERALDMFNFELLLDRPMHVMWSDWELMGQRTNRANIFIQNLDESIDSVALFDTFSTFGRIMSCKVVDSKGYIQYEAAEAAALAIERLNGMMLNDRKVTIQYFKPRKERKPEDRPSAQHRASNLFVKNLDKTIDDECLRMVFGQFGRLTSAKVITENGRSKGFGFVSFTSSQEAAMAKNAMNGRIWGGKRLHVGEALRKEARQARLEHQKAQELFGLPLTKLTTALRKPVLPPNLKSTLAIETAPTEDPVQAVQVINMAPTEHPVQAVQAMNTAPTEDPVQAVQVINMAPTEDPVQAVQAMNTAPTEDPVQAVQVINMAPTEDPVQAVQAMNMASTKDPVPAVPALNTAPTEDPVQAVQAMNTAPTEDPVQAVQVINMAPTEDPVQAVQAMNTAPTEDPVTAVPALNTAPTEDPVQAAQAMNTAPTEDPVLAVPALNMAPTEDPVQAVQAMNTAPTEDPVPAVPALNTAPTEDPVQAVQAMNTAPTEDPVPAVTALNTAPTKDPVRAIPALNTALITGLIQAVPAGRMVPNLPLLTLTNKNCKKCKITLKK